MAQRTDVATCRALPKAHLHLHFTGSMRHDTLLELAERDGIALPDSLVEDWPPQLSAADEKGWFRFQRLYDVARSVLRTPDDVRRLVLEAAEDDVRGRRSVAGDPGRPERLRRALRRHHRLHRPGARLRPDALRAHRARHRRRHRRQPHPPPARRPHPGPPGRAVRRPRAWSGSGSPTTSGAARTEDFASAFRIAERAGLLLVPHGGELRGPEHVRQLPRQPAAPTGSGHGVRSAEDPALLDRIVEAGVALEVCPVSNVALGVYSDLTSVPLPQLLAAGATVALGADDPLLFGSRLAGQYATMRAAHDLDDVTLARLARMSFAASRRRPTSGGGQAASPPGSPGATTDIGRRGSVGEPAPSSSERAADRDRAR